MSRSRWFCTQPGRQGRPPARSGVSPQVSVHLGSPSQVLTGWRPLRLSLDPLPDPQPGLCFHGEPSVKQVHRERGLAGFSFIFMPLQAPGLYWQPAIRLALVGTSPRGLKKAFVLIGKTKGTQEMKLKNWLENRLASSKKGVPYLCPVPN